MDSIFIAGKNITLNGISYRIGEDVDVSEVSRKRINLLLRTGRLHTSSAQKPEKKNSGQSVGNGDSDKQSTNETNLPGSGLTKGIKPRG